MCPKNGTSTNCYYSQTGLRFSGILSSSSRIFHRQQMFSPKLAFPIMNNGWKMILSFTFCWCKNCCTSWSGSFFHDFQGFKNIPGPRWLALGFLPLRVFFGANWKKTSKAKIAFSNLLLLPPAMERHHPPGEVSSPVISKTKRTQIWCWQMIEMGEETSNTQKPAHDILL